MTVRFRFVEDERRYLLLLAESYRLMAKHLPPQVVSQVMRSFGKLEQISWLEGVRQGAACAAISNAAKLTGDEHLEHLKAFQLHAHVYGSSDTPLRDTELEWLSKLMIDASYSATAWLDSSPMRFAPQTLEEWSQGMPAAPPIRQEQVAALSDFMDNNPLSDEAIHDAMEMSDDVEPKEWPNDPSGNPAPGEMPAMLDSLRDSLRQIVDSGEQVTSWQDMIMKLHIRTGTDASFLDLQLSSEMGRAVLDQVGLINLHPGSAFNMTTFLTAQEVMEKMKSAASGDTEQEDP